MHGITTHRRTSPLALVADDDRSLRLAMRAALRRAGFSVTEAADGREAVTAFEREEPDLVLLDVMMPHLDGFAACQAIRALPNGDVAQILMVTGMDDVDSTQRAFDVGANDFIAKPINWVMLEHRSRYLFRAGRAFQELTQNSRRLAKAQDIARLGIWEIDLRQESFTCSAAAGRLLGLPMDGQRISFTDFLAPIEHSQRQRVKEGIDRAVAARKSCSLEYIIRLPNGARRHIVNYGEILRNRDGDPTMMLGYIQDISQLRQAEEEKAALEAQLRQTNKLEAIGTLAGGIAHDFNNILTVILGYTQMAIANTGTDSTDSQDLRQILKAGQRARELVKQILTFSRQTAVHRQAMDPQPVIKEAVKMLRASIPSTISIHERICPDCGPILADPTQIHQILMNLCANAFQAMEEEGGELTITLRVAPTIPAELARRVPGGAGDFLELSIADTGHGIAADIRERIFDPFFTTKTPGQGTGMGLAITYGIIKEYGGAITVDSEEHVGTCFHIYLPRCDRAPATAEIEEEIALRGKEHILLVDDDELLLPMARDMLERLGYQVTACQQSSTALAAFKANPNAFDLLLTDQAMPQHTGLELAALLHQQRSTLPVILCTGYDHLITEELARASGICRIIRKPFTMPGLAKMLRVTLDQL